MEHQDPYSHGYEDFKDGVSSKKNPYDETDECDATEWLRGWEDSKEDCLDSIQLKNRQAKSGDRLKSVSDILKDI
ncbi:hypothetical protein [Microbulbifer variabilis]|uniref:hypothetical protein n=1 Tax=Microbulbifer variabilis TaxID=266805 RepID=UPI000372E71B|nr:hypothetical protein [Microbulbifer variabilis]